MEENISVEAEKCYTNSRNETFRSVICHVFLHLRRIFVYGGVSCQGHLAATGTITAPALEFSRASTYDASLQVRSDSDTLWGSTLQLS
jgi:hypothetical protein